MPEDQKNVCKPLWLGADQGTHWRVLSEQWDSLGSPLRPCAEDILLAGEMLGCAISLKDRGRRAWLLGVTPEIASAPWLQPYDLIAVERAQPMINTLWYENSGGRLAVCADWRNSPLPGASIDLVVGDGCLTVVDFPEGLTRLLREAYRCLTGDGHLMLRLFCRPDAGEAPEQVIAALLSGKIGSIHAFKWRLLMAVQSSDDTRDVAVARVWEIWDGVRREAQRQAVALGWPPAAVATMELYRDSPARYNFMTYGATMHELRSAGFELLSMRTGTYELAERCPHVLLAKCAGEGGVSIP